MAGVRYGLRDFSRDQVQSTDLFVGELAERTQRDIAGERGVIASGYTLDHLLAVAPSHELIWSRACDYLSVAIEMGASASVLV